MDREQSSFEVRVDEFRAAVRSACSRDAVKEITDRFLREGFGEEAGSAVAVFYRYHSVDCEEFDSIDEAARFLDGGCEYNTLAPEAIRAGDRIIRRDELDQLMDRVSVWRPSPAGLLTHPNS